MAKFLLIDKPKDWTSHDVVAYVRNIVRNYYKKTSLPGEASHRLTKTGHAGTLDPFATGLLIVGIERDATKRLDEFKALPKTYIATIKLGAVSDTYDSTGKISPPIRGRRRGGPLLKEVKSVLKQFIGQQKQIPPMYSAKKIKGKKLYELARQGIELERKPNDIEIYNIKLLEYTYPQLKIEVKCSTGTYIRTLSYDIGEALNTGAYCDELIRTKIGSYNLANAVEPKEITKENFIKI